MSLFHSVEAEFDRIKPTKDNLMGLIRELSELNDSMRSDIERTAGSFVADSATLLIGKEVKLNEYSAKEIGIIQEIVEDITKTAEGLYRIEMINDFLGKERRYF